MKIKKQPPYRYFQLEILWYVVKHCDSNRCWYEKLLPAKMAKREYDGMKSFKRYRQSHVYGANSKRVN